MSVILHNFASPESLMASMDTIKNTCFGQLESFNTKHTTINFQKYIGLFKQITPFFDADWLVLKPL